MKILLLEDDISLNQTITHILRLEQHDVVRCYNGNEAISAIDSDELFDLYLFDLNVPYINGKNVLEYLYGKDKNAKVIIISAQTDIKTITEVYDSGCVDFLKKPFHIDELICKLDLYKTDSIVYISKEIYFDYKKEKFYKDNEELELSHKEFKLLAILSKNINTTVRYETLYHKLYDDTESTYALRALVKRLREKFNDTFLLEAVPKEGYILKVNFDKSLIP